MLVDEGVWFTGGRMASATNSVPGEEVKVQKPNPVPLPSIAWFAALLILCYLPVLMSMVKNWSENEDMGHGFFVPVVAAYIAWQKRDELFREPAVPSLWGWPLLLWGAAQCYLGELGAELFLQRSAFLVSTVGAVLLTGGLRAIRILSLPLFMLLFMVPIPAIIYNQITFPLQLFASRVAEVTLNAIGIPVLREGNVLELANQKLSVV